MSFWLSPLIASLLNGVYSSREDLSKDSQSADAWNSWARNRKEGEAYIFTVSWSTIGLHIRNNLYFTFSSLNTVNTYSLMYILYLLLRRLHLGMLRCTIHYCAMPVMNVKA